MSRTTKDFFECASRLGQYVLIRDRPAYSVKCTVSSWNSKMRSKNRSHRFACLETPGGIYVYLAKAGNRSVSVVPRLNTQKGVFE